jgi:hypothetical protein
LEHMLMFFPSFEGGHVIRHQRSLFSRSLEGPISV